MEKFLAVFLGLIAVSSATILPCSAGKGLLPKSVVVQDCDANERCSFVRGRSFKADVQFTARKNIRLKCCWQKEESKLKCINSVWTSLDDPASQCYDRWNEGWNGSTGWSLRRLQLVARRCHPVPCSSWKRHHLEVEHPCRVDRSTRSNSAGSFSFRTRQQITILLRCSRTNCCILGQVLCQKNNKKANFDWIFYTFPFIIKKH